MRQPGFAQGIRSYTYDGSIVAYYEPAAPALRNSALVSRVLRFEIDHENWDHIAAITATRTLYVPQAAMIVRDAFLKVSEVFDLGSADLTLGYGHASSPDTAGFLKAQTLNSLGFWGLANADKGPLLSGPSTPLIGSHASAIGNKLTVTVSGSSNLNTITQGFAELFLDIYEIPDL
jgi:hypothetical protein